MSDDLTSPLRHRRRKPRWIIPSVLVGVLACLAVYGCLASRASGGAVPYGTRGVETVMRYDSCPGPDAALEDCVPLVLALNLHYFAPNSCRADSIGFSGERLTEAEAVSVAEKLILNANTFFREISDNAPVNNVKHGALDHAPQCAPFRIALAGLYVHCNSAYATKLPTPGRLKPFLVNEDTEINYFLGNLSSSDGYAAAMGSTLGAQGNRRPSVLAHELMHMLSLRHVFVDDGCDDTFGEINWTWDKDGDGKPDARGRRCWDWLPTPRGKDGSLKAPDYCAPGNYHEPHPCCDTTNMNSNMMTYSNYASDWYKATLSPCQVEKAVRHAVTQKCAYLYGAHGRMPSRSYAVRWPERDATAR